MATFSLGTSGVTPGAPGVYINERAGVAGNPGIASFSTVYMLVEVPDYVPVTVFPYNTPVPITSINDYRVLTGGTIPTSRIPLLSYNCVFEFFANAQVGDLRVVRVGTPDNIVEIGFNPSANKANNSGLPSALFAGDVVYVQLNLNGQQLVAGDGTTGYDSNGNWLGVPVKIPVNYVPGDTANNRLISNAIATAVAAAVESNPSIRSSIFVREVGLSDDPNVVEAVVVLAGATFDAPVVAIPEFIPQNQYVFTLNAYNINDINASAVTLTRVPQDYVQCISTAFDGQQDQGYLITPTAYAQFDALGRAEIGAAAADLAANNNYKWMALADPGPYLVTDVNKYNNFVPYKASENIATDELLLVDNAIYKWIGTAVVNARLRSQQLVLGASPETAVRQSTNSGIAPGRVNAQGGLDDGLYTILSPIAASFGQLQLDSESSWPVNYTVQKVVLSGASGTNPFANYIGELFLVAPPFDTAISGDYSLNYVYLSQTQSAAVSVYNYVKQAGGSSKVTALPPGALNIFGAGTAQIAYSAPAFDITATISGQTSDLFENITNRNQSANTLHFPGTLQDPTATYLLRMFNRNFVNPTLSVTRYSTAGTYFGAAAFTCIGHGLVSGTQIYFNRPILTTSGVYLVQGSTQNNIVSYYVTAINNDTFVISTTLTNFSGSSFVPLPTADTVATSTPVLSYSSILVAPEGSTDYVSLSATSLIRGRKYAFDSSTIYDQFSPAANVPAADPQGVPLSVYLSNSATSLSEATLSAYGETPDAGWLPSLQLLQPPIGFEDLNIIYTNAGSISAIDPAYVTRSASTGQATAINSVGGILPGSQGYWNVEGEALMFVPPVWVEDAAAAPDATLTWVWEVNGTPTSVTNKVGVIAGVDFPVVAGSAITVSWTLTQGGGATNSPINGSTAATPGFVTYSDFTATGYSLVTAQRGTITNPSLEWSVGRTIAYSAATLPNSVPASAPVLVVGTGGSGFSNSTLPQATTGGSGNGCTLNIITTAGAVTSATIASGGAGYVTGNVLSVPTYPGVQFTVTGASAISVTANTYGFDTSTASGAVGSQVYTGSRTVLQSVGAVPSFFPQVAVAQNGNYVNLRTSFTIGTVTVHSTVSSPTPIGPLQVGANCTWATPGVVVPATWNVEINQLNLNNIGPQNFVVSPTGQQFAAGGTNFVPSSDPTVVGDLNATTLGVTPVGFGASLGIGATVPVASSALLGYSLYVTVAGSIPAGVLPNATTSAIVASPGDQFVVVRAGSGYAWAYVSAQSEVAGYGQILWGSTLSLNYSSQEISPPSNLWRFGTVTPTEVISDALRGVFTGGTPTAEFIESGVDNVNRLLDDSQRYFNPFGFIAYYGPYVRNTSGQWIPPSPYVTGVAVRRYRAEGYQFPPAGVKFQLSDASATQIPINSAQQNILNPKGCNALRTLPGYPQTAIFIWGGRTRINELDSQQRLYQFVNTRVILNVVYGSLRNAFDSQIFNVIDGFGIAFNQIISVGNSVLNQLYVKGALFGARPSDAFQVICDARINPPAELENGIINAKVFVTPVPTLERIQIDLIRVAIGQMQNELDAQGLGSNNAGL